MCIGVCVRRRHWIDEVDIRSIIKITSLNLQALAFPALQFALH